MADPLYIDAGELPTEEILAAIQDGRRVVISMEAVGDEHRVTLRHDGSRYYCDTPTRLHRHDSEDEMRTCIHRMGYASDSPPD